MKRDPRFHHWAKKLPGCKQYRGFLDVLESIIPFLVAVATLLLFFLLIINPGTLLAVIVFLLVLALLGFVKKC
jgi:mannose/fructose/N-acetylgalactosamine-specific phosphotransferase system component IID